MKSRIFRRKSAFTLIETLVSIAIVGFIVVAASMGTLQLLKSGASNNRLQATNSIQNASEWISNDARNAESVDTTDGTRLIFTWHDAGASDEAHKTTVTYQVVTDSSGSHLQRNFQYGTGVREIHLSQKLYAGILSLVDTGTGPAPEPVRLWSPGHPVNDDGRDCAPSVRTDKDDYQPGETVFVTGSGFLPLEAVRLSASGTPNGVRLEASARCDAQGEFQAVVQLPPPPQWDDLYVLTATGEQSGFCAQTSFTDAANSTITVTFSGAGAGTVGVYNSGGTLLTTLNNTIPARPIKLPWAKAPAAL